MPAAPYLGCCRFENEAYSAATPEPLGGAKEPEPAPQEARVQEPSHCAAKLRSEEVTY